MIFLLASIILTTVLILSFKAFRKLDVNPRHAIAINYLTAVIIGFLLSDNDKALTQNFLRQPWLPYTAILGFLFITVFYLLGKTSDELGAAVASVSNKLSMVIPVVFAFFLYDEDVNILKITGIIAAIAAVILTSIQKKDDNKRRTNYLLPVLVFIGSGIIDTLIKYVQDSFIKPDQLSSFFPFLFAMAAIIGLCVMLFEIFFKKKTLTLKTIIGGILLGTANYGALYFLIKALSKPGWESSVIFPINNIGVVALSVLGARFVFKEKFSPLNWMGVIVAFIAIGLMILS